MSHSLKYPKPDNPIHFVVRGHVPALKNNKIWIDTDKGKYPIPNKEVVKFVKKVRAVAYQKIHEQNFDIIEVDTPVCLLINFWFFTNQKSGISRADTDNAVTMIQEMLETPHYNDQGKIINPLGVLDILDDDKQVVEIHAQTYPVLDRKFEGAQIFIYTIDDIHSPFARDLDYQVFKEWQSNWRKAGGDKPLKIEIDFDSLEDILTS